MDVIKYLLPALLFFTLPGKAQHFPDSLNVYLPDTVLSTEKTLFFLEDKTDLYFSYNPGIFTMESAIEWKKGKYNLQEILDRISKLENVLYTPIGNQVVFHLRGQEPDHTFSPQEEPEFTRDLKIKGRILARSEKEALAYATIWLPSTWQGTIANSDGYFILNIPGELGSDTISISCMGYSTADIPLSELSDSINIIYLQTSVIPIQEVVIRRTDPVNLLQQALNNIPDNYSENPVIETAFYRETIQKNDQYIAVSEGVVEIYKPGFDALSTEQVKVLRGRKNIDFSLMDTLMVKLKAGLETSFLLDIIRNRPDFLQPEQFSRYEYRMSDIVVIQDKSAYAIDFDQKETTKPPHFRGRIYIDLESLAILGVEFDVDPKTISSLANSMIYKKPRRFKVRPVSASYLVRYKLDGGQFHLSLIRAENQFRIRVRKKLFGNEFRTVSEMAVTGLETREVSRFRTRETANTMDIFTDMLGGYDPGFWGPYNYIIPEESLEDALIRISHLMPGQ